MNNSNLPPVKHSRAQTALHATHHSPPLTTRKALQLVAMHRIKIVKDEHKININDSAIEKKTR
jgi:hypothetical protein